jgi:hypothetical protein
VRLCTLIHTAALAHWDQRYSPHLLSPCSCPTLASLLLCAGAMNVGYVTAIAALAGAALGGLTSFANSWTTLHAQMKAQRLASSKSRRRKLYKQFIDEASRTYVDALVHDKLEVSGLVGIYALISRMRVLSSEQVIECAVNIALLITDTYFQPNKTPTEIQAMMHGGGVDPLRDFSDVCRQELETDLLA